MSEKKDWRFIWGGLFLGSVGIAYLLGTSQPPVREVLTHSFWMLAGNFLARCGAAIDRGSPK